MNSKNTTALKIFFIPSIVFAMLIFGGVIPAYAQVVYSADSVGNPTDYFFDYEYPACTNPVEIYASGAYFNAGTRVDIHLLSFPSNGNTDDTYATLGNVIAIPYSGHPDVEASIFDSIIPADGRFYILLAAGVSSNTYNIVIDADRDTWFTPGIDVIDVVNNYGLAVHECEKFKQQQLVTVKDSSPTRHFTVDDSPSIEGKNLSTDNSSPVSWLHVLADAALTQPTNSNTITDLSSKSVFFAEVVITEQGEFERTITWNNPEPGTYNVILDVDNDDVYTPGVDIIDYYDEVGFTVHSSHNLSDITSTCILEVVPNEVTVDWYDYIPIVGLIDLTVKAEGFHFETICPGAIRFGTTIIGGDFNGDGVNDLTIGIPEHDAGHIVATGAVHVSYGNPIDHIIAPNLPSYAHLLSQDVDGIEDVVEAGDLFGYSVTVGDFNGDGYDDLAIGVPEEDIDSISDAGAVNIVYGSSVGLTDIDDQMWHQDIDGVNTITEAGDRFGHSITAGDFNGDGYDDLVIGVPEEDIDSISDAGAVNIVYGSSTGLTSINEQIWNQDSIGIEDDSEADDYFGTSLIAGDFNNDGYDDLAIGVSEEDVNGNNNAGAVNIIYGSNGGLTDTNNQIWHQDVANIEDISEAGDYFGTSITAGDFNIDGYDDLAIGVPEEDVNGNNNAGAVNIVYGSSIGLTDNNNQIWHQDIDGVNTITEAGDRFGHSITAGDFNNDGIDDLVVGVPDEEYLDSEDDVGAVNIIYGLPESGLSVDVTYTSYPIPVAVSAVTDNVRGFIVLDGARSITTVVIDDISYALVTGSLDDGVQIIDISNPRSPIAVSAVKDGLFGFNTLDGAHDITTVLINGSTYALVASYNDNGIQIIDISNPRSPIAVSAVIDNVLGFTELDGARGITTIVIDGITYALVASYNDDGIQIIDISNPRSPIPVSAITDNVRGFTELDGAHDITTIVIDGITYALVASNIDDGIQIIDISNPRLPIAVFAVTDGDNGFTELDGALGITTVLIDGTTYALVTSNIDDGIQIIDISNPSSPIAVSTITDNVSGFNTLDSAHDITTIVIDGITYALVASYNDDGIQIIDISNPRLPIAVSAVIDGDNGFTELDGALGITTIVIDGISYALVASYNDDGIQIINIGIHVEP